MDRKVLTAPEGKIFTNGEVYGVTIYLAEGIEETSFYEITIEEYNRILAEQEALSGGEI